MLISALCAACWLVGGVLTHASNVRLSVKTFERMFDEHVRQDGGLPLGEHNCHSLVWKLTWVDVFLGPLLLTRQPEAWAFAWAGMFYAQAMVELSDDDDE